MHCENIFVHWENTFVHWKNIFVHWEIIVLYCEKLLRVGIILLCDQKVVLWIETFCCALRIWATVSLSRKAKKK